MATQNRRAFFLHASALSDAEYPVYFDALHDILDEPESSGGPGCANLVDMDMEAHVIGVRDARIWMRGWFKNMGNLSNVDKVCFYQFEACMATISYHACSRFTGSGNSRT